MPPNGTPYLKNIPALVCAGIILFSGCAREHTSEEVIAAAESYGFTHQQALFLRYGPFHAVTLCMESFSESQCRFFAEHQNIRTSDAEFRKDCTLVGLRIYQCNLLRFGVQDY
jgi:hypothetical protein